MGKRLDTKTKKIVAGIVRENAALMDHEIAVILNDRGFRNTKGNVIDSKFVANFRRSMGYMKRGRRKPVPNQTPILTAKGKDLKPLVELVIGCDLSKQQKLRVIEALL